MTNNNDVLILAQTIYGEARGEILNKNAGVAGLIAVGNVIINRSKRPQRFGNTIAEICQKPFQFSCWNKNDLNRDHIIDKTPGSGPIFDLCCEVSVNLIARLWPDITNGADHYHAPMDHLPKWAISKIPTLKLGNHKFYKIG